MITKENLIKLMGLPIAGVISVTNKTVWNDVRFSLTYTLFGEQFSEYAEPFAPGVTRSLSIPEGATKINLKVEVKLGFNWSDICGPRMFAEPVTKCYKVSGTIFEVTCEEIPC